MWNKNREIESLWNGRIELQDGNHYIITNAGYNGNIYAGPAITIGFNASEGIGSEESRNCKLYSDCANSTGNGTVEVDKNQDTDGLSNIKETKPGTNPFVYDETFDIVLYADEEDTIKASVHAILKGRQVESLSVEKFNNDFFFPTTMPGYIGGAYDFQVTEGFGSDTIQFDFNAGLLADASFAPIIYYFNEELQQLEALKTSVTGNVASAQISRCEKYILLNKTAYEAAFEWEEVESYNADSGIAVKSLIDELDDSATGAGRNSEQDSDGDGRLDLQEYKEGTSPYSYDKDWYEHLWDFVCGFVAGDFIHDTDSIATTLGQIASSFIPLVDVRDVIGNLVHGDFLFAGLSATGLIPVGGDLAKTAGKVGKFVLKNIDDIAKVSDILEFLVKNLPDVLPYLAGSDEFADAMKQLSKVDTSKITKKQADVINEALEKAGVSKCLIKYGKPNEIGDLLEKMPELTGKTRDKLLAVVQNDDLLKIVDQLYRPGATVGDGGTAAILVEEFELGTARHLIKAKERLKQLKGLIGTGKLGLSDLDIAEALIDDLEYAIHLFE